IITQNIDDLHERAGSTRVIHLHGELVKARSSVDPALRYDIGYTPIALGECCEHGSQLRPDVVWFGEMVPRINDAADLMPEADEVLVVGTSLQVYPAAGLVQMARPEVPVTVIDPGNPAVVAGATIIPQPAT